MGGENFRDSTTMMMAYIFATSGIGSEFGWSDDAAYMNTRHLPMIPVLLAIAMVIELAVRFVW